VHYRWLAGVSLSLVVVASCSGAAGQARRDAGRSAAVAVSTAPVRHISIQRTVDLAGTLISPDQAKVSAEAPGVVESVSVQLGDEVRKGQELVRLAPRELELALQRAESALRQTEAQLGMSGADSQPLPDDRIATIRTAAANLDDARTQNTRAEQLAGRGLLAGAEVEATRTRLKVAEAAYESALETVRSLKASLQDRRAAYELAQKKLNDAVIKAPVAGAVSERLVQPGEFIKEDTPVITLVQMDPLKLSTAAQEKYAGVLKPGMAVQFTVESYPNEMFRGRIVSVSPAVDQATRTFVVEAELPNPDHRLKPGFFAKGVILTHIDQNVVAAPDDAVSTLAGVSTVFVIENGKVKPETVTVGVHQGNLFEIVDGLKGGETLAASNLSQLAAGVAVTTRRSQ
jgi:RND family efflux transporter MFP subunit